jgi:hypothetical protein
LLHGLTDKISTFDKIGRQVRLTRHEKLSNGQINSDSLSMKQQKIQHGYRKTVVEV